MAASPLKRGEMGRPLGLPSPSSSLLAIVLLLLASCAVSPSEGCCAPPTGVWCQYQQLPETVPFAVTQDVWWNEYFLFNATTTTTIGFKFYAGMASLENFSVIVAENYCPNFADVSNAKFPMNLTLIFSYGTASVEVNVTEGESYVIFGHMSGNNYTLAGCDGPCPQACPNDCTNIMQGICNVTSETCFCYQGWAGSDCNQVCTREATCNGHGTCISPSGVCECDLGFNGTVNCSACSSGYLGYPNCYYPNGTNGTVNPHHHHHVPFGSEAVFIFIIAGLPTVVVITAITGTIIYLAYLNKEKNLKRKEKQPLLYPPPSSSFNGNGNGNGYANGHHQKGYDKDKDNRNSVNLSPAFPPPPPQYERVPSPVITPSAPFPSTSPPSSIPDPAHRSPEEQQTLHRRNNNKG